MSGFSAGHPSGGDFMAERGGISAIPLSKSAGESLRRSVTVSPRDRINSVSAAQVLSRQNQPPSSQIRRRRLADPVMEHFAETAKRHAGDFSQFLPPPRPPRIVVHRHDRPAQSGIGQSRDQTRLRGAGGNPGAQHMHDEHLAKTADDRMQAAAPIPRLGAHQ